MTVNTLEGACASVCQTGGQGGPRGEWVPPPPTLSSPNPRAAGWGVRAGQPEGVPSVGGGLTVPAAELPLSSPSPWWEQPACAVPGRHTGKEKRGAAPTPAAPESTLPASVARRGRAWRSPGSHLLWDGGSGWSLRMGDPTAQEQTNDPNPPKGGFS